MQQQRRAQAGLPWWMTQSHRGAAKLATMARRVLRGHCLPLLRSRWMKTRPRGAATQATTRCRSGYARPPPLHCLRRIWVRLKAARCPRHCPWDHLQGRYEAQRQQGASLGAWRVAAQAQRGAAARRGGRGAGRPRGSPRLPRCSQPLAPAQKTRRARLPAQWQQHSRCQRRRRHCCCSPQQRPRLAPRGRRHRPRTWRPMQGSWRTASCLHCPSCCELQRSRAAARQAPQLRVIRGATANAQPLPQPLWPSAPPWCALLQRGAAPRERVEGS